jgi:hypothetical protein
MNHPKRPELDDIELAISGEPRTTLEQDALLRRVKVWGILTKKRLRKWLKLIS